VPIQQDVLEDAFAVGRARRRLPDPQTCRLIRVTADVPLRALARHLGEEPSSLSRWERGIKRPSDRAVVGYLEALVRLADEAGLSELIGEGAVER